MGLKSSVVQSVSGDMNDAKNGLGSTRANAISARYRTQRCHAGAPSHQPRAAASGPRLRGARCLLDADLLIGLPPGSSRSCPLQRLAQDPGGPEDQDDHENEEGDDVLPL